MTLLHYFVLKGDVDGVRACFAAAPNGQIGLKRDCFDFNPLQWAVKLKHQEIVDIILHHAKSYNAQMGEVLWKQPV